jgi:protein ImuB
MFACIYVPNFSVAAALRAEPELKSRAVAILEGKPPLEVILAVNENARRMSIAPGMTKAQAELCAELVLRPRSSLHESAAHAALLDCAQSFSPCVEDTTRDTVLLDLAGMESLFGSLPDISRAIFARTHALGFDANVALASNPDAAVLAARGFPDVTVISTGEESEKLGPLSLRVLFADCEEDDKKETVGRLLETLARWGIRNLRALAALPEIALSERLGQEGLRLQQLARGAAARNLVPVEEPLQFEEAIELEHPIVLLEPLAFLLNRLLENLCARLASCALATQELRLTLELDPTVVLEDESLFNQPSKINHQKFLRTLHLPLPMLDTKIFLKLLQLDLNAHPPGAPIVKIHLAAEPARPRPGQAGLFLPPTPEPEKLELTLARIAGMVGEQSVGSIEILDTHHPEGFRLRHFVSETPPKSSMRKKSDSAANDPVEEKPAVTALRRFGPPLRADVTLKNGQPVHLVCRKRRVHGTVLWKAGPWRFSGDWWEREAWSRDEWDIAVLSNASQNDSVQNHGGIALYRLVHDLLGGVWFVEGTYD